MASCPCFCVIVFMNILMVWVCVSPPCQAELFTAISELENLLEQEKGLIFALEGYIRSEETRINTLKNYAERFSNVSMVGSHSAEYYLSNPINAFLLVKRFTNDWKSLESLVSTNYGQEFLNILHTQQSEFPGTDDLSGAAHALLRLQDTYKLQTTQLADGRIHGTNSISELTASDCYDLGQQAYIEEDYYHAILWLNEALSRLASTSDASPLTRFTVIDHLAFSYYQIGDHKKAYQYTLSLLEIDPEHQRALSNKEYFEQYLADSIRKRGDDGNISPPQPVRPVLDEERTQYETLCRGDQPPLDPKILRRLKCRYRNYGKAKLLLQPVKEEILYTKPKIWIWHGLITDSEIDFVKKKAGPRLKRATVQNSFTGQLEPAPYRISKSAWLSDSENEIIARISRRVEAVTGLDMSASEELQVVNYGIGGHYEPHFDFARREEINAFKDLGLGNRIATMIFYMSDVIAGGATVFPRINVRLFPEKGAGAFWFNLLRSGEGDFDTRHAACPVLVGSKWVANKWIHEYKQEFHRPCALNPAL